MIKLIRSGVYYMEGRLVKESVAFMVDKKKQSAIKGTVAYGIINAHNGGSDENLKLKFDGLISEYWNGEQIIECASALGVSEFVVPTTIVGEDIQVAQKFGFDRVSSRITSAHHYLCEYAANCGNLFLSADEGIGCGALGAMSVTEDSLVLVKQLIKKAYKIARPQTVAIYLKGKPKKGVGAYDVALSLVAATQKTGFLKGKILEVIGSGIKNISVDFRVELDSLLCKTGCFASVWETDGATEEYYKNHGREQGFKPLRAADPAFYDAAAVIDLSRVEPMIADEKDGKYYTVKEFIEKANEITEGKYESGEVKFSHGIVGDVGCESVGEVCEILKAGKSCPFFTLGVRTKSATAFKSLADGGCASVLSGAGVSVNMLPFGNSADSRFTLDSRTLAATAANGGVLIPATAFDYARKYKKFNYDCSVYEKKVYRGYGKPDKDLKINIEPSYEYPALPENVRYQIVTDGEEDYLLDGAFGMLAVKQSKDCGDYIKDCGCQAVVALDYISARNRLNLVNWGVLPFTCRKFDFKTGDVISIENIAELIKSDCTAIPAKHISEGKTKNIMLDLPPLTEEEKKILLVGGLINYKN